MNQMTKRMIEGTMMLGLLAFAACGGGEDGQATSGSETSTESTSAETKSDDASGSGLELVAPRDSQCGLEKGDPLDRIKVDEEDGVVQNALVYVKGVDKALKGERPPETVTIDQEKCIFVPRWTYVLREGGTVTVKNSDPELHNFRYQGSSDFGAQGNENQAPGAKPIDIEMNGPEWVDFRCNVHPWMIGLMRVSEHHAVARTGEDGSFSFEVPSGTYTLVVHHPELDGPVEQEVDVPEGETVSQDVPVSFE